MSIWLQLLLMFGPVLLLLIAGAALWLRFVLTWVRAGTRQPAGITTMPSLNVWWDGRHLRYDDPKAPHSPDGYYWWDGAAWRPVR